ASGVQLASGWMRTRATSAIQTVADESPDTFAHLLQGAPTGAVASPVMASPPPLQTPPNTDPNAVEVVAGSPAAAELALADTFDPPPLLAGSTPLAATDEPATRTTTLPRIRFGDSPSVLGPESERVQELQLRLS